MNEEERLIYERDAARCRYRAQQLLGLSGSEAAAQQVRDDVEALLPRFVPWPPCTMPYHAPELIP